MSIKTPTDEAGSAPAVMCSRTYQ